MVTSCSPRYSSIKFEIAPGMTTTPLIVLMIYTDGCRARDMFLHRNNVHCGLEMDPFCLQTVSIWTLVWFNASFFLSRELGNYKSGTLDSTSRWSYYTYAVSAKKSIWWELPLVVLVVLLVTVVVMVVVVLLLLLLLFLLLVALIAFVDKLRWNCCTHNHKLFSSLNFKLNSLWLWAKWSIRCDE